MDCCQGSLCIPHFHCCGPLGYSHRCRSEWLMMEFSIFSIVMRALESSVRGSTSAFLTFIGNWWVSVICTGDVRNGLERIGRGG